MTMYYNYKDGYQFSRVVQSGNRWKGFNLVDPKFQKEKGKHSQVQDGVRHLHALAQLCTFTVLKEKLPDNLIGWN